MTSTSVAAQSNEPLVNYQLRLPGYEGPLDVLLRLIERNLLNITDISLVSVTSQFLDYATSLTEAPDSVIASFATVGSRLAVLKSRSLLPRPEHQDEDDDVSDLTRQLLDYRQTLHLSAHLAQRQSLGLRSYRSAVDHGEHQDLRSSTARLGQYSPAALARVLRRRLTVAPRPIQVLPRRRVISLRDTVHRILHLTSDGDPIPFSAVTVGYVSRTEVATAFLGVLVLVKREAISVGQRHGFAEIDLHRTEGSAALGEIREGLNDA